MGYAIRLFVGESRGIAELDGVSWNTICLIMLGLLWNRDVWCSTHECHIFVLYINPLEPSGNYKSGLRELLVTRILYLFVTCDS